MTDSLALLWKRTGRRATSATATTVIVVVVAAPRSAATGGGLHATLAAWSKKASGDARRISFDARLRHPVAMAHSALRFRTDALHAHAAIAALHPGKPRQRQAQRLAIQAFTDYATAGSQWAASGDARHRGKNRAAVAYARAAAAAASAGSKLLVAAGQYA